MQGLTAGFSMELNEGFNLMNPWADTILTSVLDRADEM